jgi:hypothetical protein
MFEIVGLKVLVLEVSSVFITGAGVLILIGLLLVGLLVMTLSSVVEMGIGLLFVGLLVITGFLFITGLFVALILLEVSSLGFVFVFVGVVVITGFLLIGGLLTKGVLGTGEDVKASSEPNFVCGGPVNESSVCEFEGALELP